MTSQISVGFELVLQSELGDNSVYCALVRKVSSGRDSEVQRDVAKTAGWWAAALS